VRQLLSQTAGLPGYTDLPDFSRRSALPVTPEGLVASVAKEAFPFPPGTRFADSSTAWCLLGMIVENVSGRRLADFFDRRIGMPAGLTTTRLDAAGDVVPRRARGYERKGEEFRQPAFQHPTWAFAGDGVLSTIRDLARWAVVLRDGSFLPRTSLDTMWTQVSLTGGGRFPFGLGWNVGSYRGRKAVWLAGEGRGFSSATLVFPTDGLTIVVLTNGAASGPLRIARGIASFVDPGLPFVERIGTRPDTEPARAERIRGALQEVESSPADVRFLTPGLAAALTPAQRSLAAALSRARRVLGLVTSDRPAPGLDVYGSKIAQVCTYRYELQDGSGLDANLWLTAEGRVAWMETETDQ
jgi:CubicO group peptidase (beta-lactamase class C family)